LLTAEHAHQVGKRNPTLSRACARAVAVHVTSRSPCRQTLRRTLSVVSRRHLNGILSTIVFARRLVTLPRGSAAVLVLRLSPAPRRWPSRLALIGSPGWSQLVQFGDVTGTGLMLVLARIPTPSAVFRIAERRPGPF